MSERSFTLVEVIVAFAIFVVLMGLVMAGFRQVSMTMNLGKKISAGQQRQRAAFNFMSREIGSFLKTPEISENPFSAGQRELYFLFAGSSGVGEARYTCTDAGTLERYKEEVSDGNPATFTEHQTCLEQLASCEFSDSDGTQWSGTWDTSRGSLPRAIKLTFQAKNEDQPQEVIVAVPVSQ